MSTKVAINASNLHTGGGLQVATSFFNELSSLEPRNLDLYIYASSEVDISLRKMGSKVVLHKNYKILNTYGISAFFSPYSTEFAEFPLVFTIFGPNYLRGQNNIQLVGFAQPWILDKSAYRILNFKDKIKLRTKFSIQSFFFRKASKLIVELEHVKESLAISGIAREKNIEVAHNCISTIYFDPRIWEPLSTKIDKRAYTIGYLGRDYKHKNTELLPKIKNTLKTKHGLDVVFIVTFSDQEWEKKSPRFKESIFNVGTLSVTQCPNFYKAVDAIIFPSLLECFSATPLEAMAMQKPLFASDRSFVRDICGDYAFYFDPLSPESAANIIADYIVNKHDTDQSRLSAARDHVLGFSSARGRAERYLEIIHQTLAENSIQA